MKNALFLLLSIVVLISCKKEIGKKEYILNFRFESGETLDFDGKVFEKYKKNKKYLAQIDYGYPMNEIEKFGLFLKFSDNNTIVMLKHPDGKLICNDQWEFWNNFPPVLTNGQSGKVKGDIYMEGVYTQKGRAYTVEDGNFEFYWRNAMDFGMNDSIITGTWSLKRK